jgi:hypothetical protein
MYKSVRAAYLGRSESPISDSAPDRKAPRWLNATVPPQFMQAGRTAGLHALEVLARGAARDATGPSRFDARSNA